MSRIKVSEMETVQGNEASSLPRPVGSGRGSKFVGPNIPGSAYRSWPSLEIDIGHTTRLRGTGRTVGCAGIDSRTAATN